MNEGIPAIYDKGVFRPLGPVELPDQAVVRIFPSVETQEAPVASKTALPGFGAWADAGEDLEDTITEVMRWRSLPRSAVDFPNGMS